MGIYFIVAVIMGLVGLLVGGNRGRPGIGFVLGALLGLIGIIIIMVMEPHPDSPVAQQRAQALRANTPRTPS